MSTLTDLALNFIVQNFDTNVKSNELLDKHHDQSLKNLPTNVKYHFIYLEVKLMIF